MIFITKIMSRTICSSFKGHLQVSDACFGCRKHSSRGTGQHDVMVILFAGDLSPNMLQYWKSAVKESAGLSRKVKETQQYDSRTSPAKYKTMQGVAAASVVTDRGPSLPLTAGKSYSLRR